MSVMQVITDLFFHALIIIAVYERVKHFLKAISAYRKTGNHKDVLAELVILSMVVLLSGFIYYYFIYKV